MDLKALNITFNSYSPLEDINDNCTQIEDSWHARGAAGITCLLITLILLCELLCDHRAYKTTLQRLVLYYTILSFVYHIILNSVNGIVHNHSPPLPGNLTALENAAMYFANAAFFLPAIIINYLMSLILRLCCGCYMRHPQTKSSTFITELVCILLGVLLSLMWLPANTIDDFKHFSFDIFYTVYASGCQANNMITDKEPAIAVALSVVIIGEMVGAVVVLNLAHYKVRLQVRGQQVLALERKTHVIVTAVALIYVIGITVSFPLFLLEQHNIINWNTSEIFLAIWFPILNQCNLFILYVASIRTTNHPLFCLQRKKPQATDHTDKKHVTHPSSHPFDQPSHTTFRIPYTGAFTDITKTSGFYSGDDNSSAGEAMPLLEVGKLNSSSYSAQTDSGV